MIRNERNGSIKGNTSAEVMFNKIVILVGFAFGFAVLAVMILINDQLPEPYMDEIFHVQQTQTYCKGNFTHVRPMSGPVIWWPLIMLCRLLVEPEDHNPSWSLPDHSGLSQALLRIVCLRRRWWEEDMSTIYTSTHECDLHVSQLLPNVSDISSDPSVHTCKPSIVSLVVLS